MFLILTRAGDIDAHSIAWALSELGHKSRVLSYGDLRPNVTGLSAKSNNEKKSLKWGNFEIFSHKVDAIWIRKSPLPIIHLHDNPRDNQNPFEQGNLDETLNLHLNGAVHAASSLGPTINDQNYSSVANNKLYQLNVCSLSSLRVPKTYIGCDKEDILNFFDGHETIVYKPLRHNVWFIGDNKAKVCKTTLITHQELSETNANELMPGVFQELVNKVIEYRVIVFGDEVVCIEQKPIKGTKHMVDWRFSADDDFVRASIILPKTIRLACVTLVKSLKLDHASIDIAVDEQGENYFLEANPFGQFLAYEGELPETRLLERSAKLMLKKANIDHTKYDFSSITTKNFLTNFNLEDLDSSVDNGDHVHDIVSRQSLSLVKDYHSR